VVLGRPTFSRRAESIPPQTYHKIAEPSSGLNVSVPVVELHADQAQPPLISPPPAISIIDYTFYHV
jgi:hypothetical protein